MSSSSSSSGYAYDVDSDDSDEDDCSVGCEYDVGAFIDEVVGTEGGDANWTDFCGPCCTDANKDVTEQLEVDGEEKKSSTFSFDDEQQTLKLINNNGSNKKRRVVKKVSVTTTEGAPKVLSPAEVAQLYRDFRYYRQGSECCAKAKTRGTNCIEFAFTDKSHIEDVGSGLAFVTACREETLNMRKTEKRSFIQGRLRSRWDGALSARAPEDKKIPQYFPYGAMNGTEPITLCQSSFAALYDVTPHSVKALVSNIMAGNGRRKR